MPYRSCCSTVAVGKEMFREQWDHGCIMNLPPTATAAFWAQIGTSLTFGLKSQTVMFNAVKLFISLVRFSRKGALFIDMLSNEIVTNDIQLDKGTKHNKALQSLSMWAVHSNAYAQSRKLRLLAEILIAFKHRKDPTFQTVYTPMKRRTRMPTNFNCLKAVLHLSAKADTVDLPILPSFQDHICELLQTIWLVTIKLVMIWAALWENWA